MERVHPANSDYSGEMNHSSRSSDPSSSPLYSFHFEKQLQAPAPPPPSAYVVQVPKDQIYRVPPPQNARLYEHYTRRAKRRRRCSCFCMCSYLLFAMFIFAVLLAISAGIVYLVFKPKPPTYSLEAFTVSGLDGVGNASIPDSFSPEFDATINANNPNSKIGVYYDDGSSIAVSYNGINVAKGAWPAFYQEAGNVTVFVAAARGAGIRFSQSMREEMATAERLKSVLFTVDTKVPVRIQLGAVKTWAVPMKVRCTVAVDKLAGDARVVSKTCKVKVHLLF